MEVCELLEGEQIYLNEDREPLTVLSTDGEVAELSDSSGETYTAKDCRYGVYSEVDGDRALLKRIVTPDNPRNIFDIGETETL